MKYIELTQNKKAIVDDDDFEYLNQWKWHIKNNGRKKVYYAVRGVWDNSRKNNRFIRMHREIMKASTNLQIDHINGNGLDNRKCNLRLCDNAQNHWNIKRSKNNTSGVRGIDWMKRKRKWRARIHYYGKEIHLGLFITPQEAARAYNQAALKYHGEFAYLNQI